MDSPVTWGDLVGLAVVGFFAWMASVAVRVKNAQRNAQEEATLRWLREHPGD